LYHLIFIVKIKNNMKVCILGNNLSALTLAKSLVNQKIYVDLLSQKKDLKLICFLFIPWIDEKSSL
jgi:2-octaprenyl-6-methoxyphenol hydroxylase